MDSQNLPSTSCTSPQEENVGCKRRRHTSPPNAKLLSPSVRPSGIQLQSGPNCAVEFCIATHMGRLHKMEDRCQHLGVEGGVAFGVFDEHRGCGAAEYCAEHLLHNIATSEAFLRREYCQALLQGFATTEQGFLALDDPSGSTATVCLVMGGTLYHAHVGDSALVHTRVTSTLLTPLHAPNKPEERQRIEAAGGQVLGHRIAINGNGRLAISRSIGDHKYKHPHPWVSPVPEIGTMDLQPGDWLVLASDGLWDAVSHHQCALFLKHAETTRNACAALLKRVCDRNLGDNSTVVVIRVNSVCVPEQSHNYRL
eukprot:NODE_3142_length_1023_cov_24.566964_g2998_i0.p1 GENE.NODE_3142_length_1023_cov_24.566964_g2998_i0~~NODE_3142_length_1023_cov_24.566964_g2998_i0.p1  ORF type:complete len:311 (-),score=63.28 NODE_3142_length_1023_cov_24.566964_g2998_i0:23-955(-)